MKGRQVEESDGNKSAFCSNTHVIATSSHASRRLSKGGCRRRAKSKNLSKESSLRARQTFDCRERERAIGSESGSVLATPSKLCTVIFQGDDSLFNVILLVKARRLSPHRTKTTMRDDWDMNHSTSTNYRHCLSWTHRHCLYLDSSLVTSSANKRKSCSTSTNMFWLRCSMIRRCRGDRQDDDCL